MPKTEETKTETPVTAVNTGKKYKFVSIGNMTVTIRGTYSEWVINAGGEPLYKKSRKPLQAQFINGYFETDDDAIAKGLPDSAPWGNEIYWHPSMADKVKGFEQSLAERIMGDQREAAQKLIEARQRRLQRGRVPRDE